MKKNLIHLMFALLIAFASTGNAEENQFDCTEQQQEGDTQLGILIIPIKSQQYAILASSQLNSTADSLMIYQYHWIEDFLSDYKLKFEDGSEWTFDPSDASIIDTWKPKDAVVISPKQQYLWTPTYTYVITNKDRGSSIDVNLYFAPIEFGSKTTWIRGLNWRESQVCLFDGEGGCSRWEVSAVDKELFDTWSHNDSVIVGQNDSYLWWFSSYDYILINVKKNHYVRAKFISSSCPCKIDEK